MGGDDESNTGHFRPSGIVSMRRVLIVDDLLATGGTAAASCKLVEKLGGTIAGLAFIVELTFLKGRDKLLSHDVFSVLSYDQ